MAILQRHLWANGVIESSTLHGWGWTFEQPQLHEQVRHDSRGVNRRCVSARTGWCGFASDWARERESPGDSWIRPTFGADWASLHSCPEYRRRASARL